MCRGSQPTERKSYNQLQAEYAVLIKDQMHRQSISVRRLVDEGTRRSLTRPLAKWLD